MHWILSNTITYQVSVKYTISIRSTTRRIRTYYYLTLLYFLIIKNWLTKTYLAKMLYY